MLENQETEFYRNKEFSMGTRHCDGYKGSHLLSESENNWLYVEFSCYHVSHKFLPML